MFPFVLKLGIRTLRDTPKAAQYGELMVCIATATPKEVLNDHKKMGKAYLVVVFL